MAKAVTVHMIGNAHLDPVWLWRWSEGMEALIATVRSVLDFLREDPRITFTASSAALYAWLEEHEPAMFAEIQQRVVEGRWLLAGGMWIEPDCNLPGGESLARQLLAGQRYFLSRFGRVATTGYNPDSFGHAGTLPMLLRAAGLDAYLFFRPGRHEKRLPEELFWWQAPDGSRVLAYRPPGHYGQGVFEPETTEQRIREHAAQCPRGLCDVISMYGIGNHGGGPTRAQLAAIAVVAADVHGPNVVHGSLDQFFARARRARADYPVVREELLHHARGCYSAHHAVKRANRELEALLAAAEGLCLWTREETGLQYPAQALDRAWRNVLFNQFHDIITGTALPEAFEDARDLHGEARTLSHAACWSAARALARRVDTHGEGQALVVFHPATHSARTAIEAEFPFDFFDTQGPYNVVDHTGACLPCQRVQGSTLTGSRAHRLLWQDRLPGWGRKLYFLRRMEYRPDVLFAPAAGDHWLENEFLRVELDPASGQIQHLTDKRTGAEMITPGSAALLVLDDQADTWGHDAAAWRDVVGCFGCERMTVEECGPVRAALRVDYGYEASRAALWYRLLAGQPWLDLVLELDWRERHKMLKWAFTARVNAPLVTASTPYGHEIRASDGEEQPCGSWVDVSESNGGCGMALINDGCHAYDAHASCLRLTVVRSPIFAWHHPWMPESSRRYQYLDQGIIKLRCRLVPHQGSWADAEIPVLSQSFHQLPLVVHEFAHPGLSAPVGAFCAVAPGTVLLSALKAAEDGEGVTVRLWETAGRDTIATLIFPTLEGKWQGTVRAHSVVTLVGRRTPQGWQWRETDLLERPLAATEQAPPPA